MSEVSVQETPAVHAAAVEHLPSTATTATPEAAAPSVQNDVPAARSHPTVVSTATHEAEAVTAAPVHSEVPVGDDAVKVEAQPIAEGLLAYKASGVFKNFRFGKKQFWFWFGDEALDDRSLATYHQNTKAEHAHPTGAHASQTGKGLLLFAKRVEDKSQPSGMINLAEVSDVTKEEQLDFSFKLHGQRHSFQAATNAERDSWIVAIQIKASEAAAAHEGRVGSEGFNNDLNKLKGPSGLAAATAAKPVSGESKSVNDKVDAGLAHPTATETTPKAAEKSRSRSRKRNSIFGTLLGRNQEHDEKKEIKKEDKAEAKELKKEEKEIKKEETAEEKAIQAEVKEEEQEAKHAHAVDASEPPPLDATAIAARVLGAPVVPNGSSHLSETTPAPVTAAPAVAGLATTETTATAPKPVKRGSVFGNLFKRDGASPTRERKDKDAAPVIPSKEGEVAPVSASAPQLDPVSTSTAPAETSPVPETSTAPTTTKGVSPTENRGGLWGFKKAKEAQHEVKKDEAALVASPAAAVPETTATDATAATPDVAPKDKRRQSFFGNISGKKEKKVEATSEGEGTDGEGKKSSGIKFGGLLRKASRSVKSGPPRPSESAPRAATGKDSIAATEASTVGESTAAPKTGGIIEPVPETGAETGAADALPEQPAPVAASA